MPIHVSKAIQKTSVPFILSWRGHRHEHTVYVNQGFSVQKLSPQDLRVQVPFWFFLKRRSVIHDKGSSNLQIHQSWQAAHNQDGYIHQLLPASHPSPHGQHPPEGHADWTYQHCGHHQLLQNCGGAQTKAFHATWTPCSFLSKTRVYSITLQANQCIHLIKGWVLTFKGNLGCWLELTLSCFK